MSSTPTNSTAARDRLQRALGYRFEDTSLISRALTHRSAGQANNERLEFIGDAVLGFVVAGILFETYPEAREDRLTLMRARLVNRETLAEVATETGLPDALSLGVGEKRSGGRGRDSIRADALEAVIGAMYLDGGIEVCVGLIQRLFGNRIAGLGTVDLRDSKTQLQEHLQGRGHPLPVYTIAGTTGQDHARLYNVTCRLEELDIWAEGSGSSRRKAEQAAAAALLSRLTANE